MGEKDLLNELQSHSNLKDGRVQPHIYKSTKHLDNERFQYNFNKTYEVNLQFHILYKFFNGRKNKMGQMVEEEML
jgi:hypothetical protein